MKAPRIVLACCLLLPALANVGKAGKLTLKQVVALVTAAPDQVIANEIHQRGMADPVSRNDVVEVEHAGAGPRTLAALRALIVTPILVVHSNQEQAEVLLDGVRKGIAGPVQALVIHDADAGKHTVTVRKPRYSTAEMPIFLVNGKANDITATLEPAVAYLSIATNAPNARVEIEGMDLTGQSPSHLELAPGPYVVHVSAPHFTAASSQITLKAGATRELEMPLTVDLSYTLSLVTQAQNELKAGQYVKRRSQASKFAVCRLPISHAVARNWNFGPGCAARWGGGNHRHSWASAIDACQRATVTT